MTGAPHTAPTSPVTSGAAPSSTMNAVVQDRYGEADVLGMGVVPVPAIGPSEVLIEVHAAGVDRGTWHLMTGRPYLARLAFGFSRPKNPVPGLDVAGRVVAVGAAVTRFAPGDAVFGIARGSFAEYAAAEEGKLAHKPESISFAQAGVATVSGITALQALTDVGGLHAGQRVLILGASGGVGTYAVQLAKAFGAEVTGVASARNLDLVRGLGADHVVDYTREDVTRSGKTYDLVVDIGGRTNVRGLRRLLTRTGTVVIVGGEGGDKLTGGMGRQLRALMVSPFVRQRLTMFINAERAEHIERLAGYLSAGTVVPSIGASYRLDDAAAALRRLTDGSGGGKSVLIVRAS